MSKQVFLLSLTLLFVHGFLWSQGTAASGTVIDESTGEPLPFVNILALPTAEGSTTDIDGAFRFYSDKKVKNFSFSYLGYETKVVSFNEFSNGYLDVTLKENDILIDEAIVIAKKNRKIPKDTAALSLQQLVVDNKGKNRPKSYDSYHFKEHNKIRYDFYKLKEKFTQRKILQPVRVAFDYIDTTEYNYAYLPLLLQEEISHYHYNKAPEKSKTTLDARYLTGIQNLSAADISEEIFESLDLYDNTITAGGKPFTSPFSTTGLVTYRYFLTDSLVKDGNTYYRLDFSPKNNKTIAFTGYAWIEDGSYALESVEFKIPSKANINYINDFYVKQSFSQPDSVNWFLTAEEIQVSINIFKNKDRSSLRVNKFMNRDSILINTPYDASVYDGEAIEVADSSKTRDDVWWLSNRIEPLTVAELGVIEMSDSIERTRVYKTLNWLGYLGSTAFIKTGPVEFGRFYQFLSWNSVEGIRPKLGLRTNKDFNENIQLWGYTAYGTRDKDWKYFASAKLMLPRVNDKWHTFQISYLKDFTLLGQKYEDQQFSHDNIMQSITRTEPLEKIMLLENFGLVYEKEWKKGLTAELSINRTNFYAVEDVFEFKKVNSDGSTEDLNRLGILEFGLKNNFAVGQKFFENQYNRLPAFSQKPVVDLSYKFGAKGLLDADYGYHKLELNYYHRWANKAGITKYSIDGGKIFGDAPYPLMFLPIGNPRINRNNSAYELMNEYEFAADQFASIWIYHHFDGKILNNIPLIKKLRFRSIFFIKGLIGSASDANQNLVLLPNETAPLDRYIETGFAIENILNVGRVDFVWRLTQRNQPMVKNFGVRFSFDVGL